MQHILSMIELEGQLKCEQEHSSAQSQQPQQLHDRLAAVAAQSLLACSANAGLRMQLSDAVANAQSQEQLLQQWQSSGANAECLQDQTSFEAITLEKQQICAVQQAQVPTFESPLTTRLPSASQLLSNSLMALSRSVQTSKLSCPSLRASWLMPTRLPSGPQLMCNSLLALRGSVQTKQSRYSSLMMSWMQVVQTWWKAL